ncbi:MAG: hypothetical protein U0903_07715 [Planctomycetales bacterium]
MNLKHSILSDLWKDESGAVITSELVLLGTVGVLGATVGLNQVSESLNGELKDVASAVRSLDQSYHVPGRSCCGAWTASSTFRQAPVEQSLQELWSTDAHQEAIQKAPVVPKKEQPKVQPKQKKKVQKTSDEEV